MLCYLFNNKKTELITENNCSVQDKKRIEMVV